VAGSSYDAFVSYRRSDAQGAASWVRRELENFRPPKRLRDRLTQRLRVYLDTAYERATNDFFEQNIKPALLASRYLVVLASPAAITREDKESDWIWREIAVFEAGPNAGNILVVRVAGEFDGPLPGDLKQRFPNMEIIDLRNTSRLWFLNPTRAARINDEKLKLLAPLLGVLPEDMPVLRQEEEKRQQRWIGAIAGATTAVLLAISTLSVFALQSRYRANQALESSMFSTGRMIATIADTIPRGNGGDARTNLLNQACDLLDKLGAEASQDPMPDAGVTCELERGVALERLGETGPAEAAVKAAAAAAEQSYRDNPQQSGAYSILAAQRELAGLYQGRKDETNYRGTLLSLAVRGETLFADHTSSPDLLVYAADAQHDVAISFENAHDTKRSLEAAEQSARLLDLAVEAQGADPADFKLAERRARWLGSVANVYNANGEAEKSIATYRRSLAAWETLLKKDTDLDARFDAAGANVALARVLASRDDGASAAPLIERAGSLLSGLEADKDKLSQTGMTRLNELRQALASFAPKAVQAAVPEGPR
jgi:tetratricopeptide (TPR) repeat protein